MVRDIIYGAMKTSLIRKLLLIVIIKFIIIFVVLKIFFFPDLLSQKYTTDKERGDAVLRHLTR
jgi:hypothetical protein